MLFFNLEMCFSKKFHLKTLQLLGLVRNVLTRSTDEEQDLRPIAQQLSLGEFPLRALWLYYCRCLLSTSGLALLVVRMLVRTWGF